MWESSSRRRPRKSQVDQLLAAQHGRCWLCKKSFARMGVKPVVHHLAGDPRKKSPITSLVLLCPNCHSKQHALKTKKTDYLLGLIQERKTKVIRKPIAPPIRRKRRSDKGRKRKKTSFWF